MPGADKVGVDIISETMHSAFDVLFIHQKIPSCHITSRGSHNRPRRAVAAAVAGDSADAGLGVLSAANAMDLDFIPVDNEEYDFALPAEYLELPHIRALIAMLKSGEFLQKLDELGGYTAEHCGEVLRVDC